MAGHIQFGEHLDMPLGRNAERSLEVSIKSFNKYIFAGGAGCCRCGPHMALDVKMEEVTWVFLQVCSQVVFRAVSGAALLWLLA